MYYCKKCGQKLNNEVKTCPYCGYTMVEDSDSFGWYLLGFLIPVAGLILYLVWKDNKPKCANRVGKGALTSVICGVVFWVFYIVIIGMMI